MELLGKRQSTLKTLAEVRADRAQQNAETRAEIRRGSAEAEAALRRSGVAEGQRSNGRRVLDGLMADSQTPWQKEREYRRTDPNSSVMVRREKQFAEDWAKGQEQMKNDEAASLSARYRDEMMKNPYSALDEGQQLAYEVAKSKFGMSDAAAFRFAVEGNQVPQIQEKAQPTFKGDVAETLSRLTMLAGDRKTPGEDTKREDEEFLRLYVDNIARQRALQETGVLSTLRSGEQWKAEQLMQEEGFTPAEAETVAARESMQTPQEKAKALLENRRWGSLDKLVKEMTEEENRQLRIVRATAGDAVAERYLEQLAPKLNERRMRGFAEFAGQYPVLGSLGSVAINTMSGVGTAKNLLDVLGGRSIDPYSDFNMPSHVVSTMRGAVADKTDSEVLKFLYNTGMSALDMATSLFFGQMAGSDTAAVKNFVQLAMASPVATSATLDAVSRGVDDKTALLIGGVAAMTEYATEAIGLDELLNVNGAAFARFVNQFASEAGEEMLSSVINTVVDIELAGDKSQAAMRITQLMEEGMSRAEAEKAVAVELVKETLLEALAGGVTGGAMALPGTISLWRENKSLFKPNKENTGALPPMYVAGDGAVMNMEEQQPVQSVPENKKAAIPDSGEDVNGKNSQPVKVQADWLDGVWTDDAEKQAILQSTASENEGGASNGTDEILGGGAERGTAVHSGGQALGVEAGTGTAGAAAEQGRTAIDRENRCANLRLKKISTKDIGLENGNDAPTLVEMPESVWDEEMRTVAQRVSEQSGRPVKYLVGNMEIDTEDGGVSIRGAITDDTVYLKANDVRYTVSELGDHELFHLYAKADSEMRAQAEEQVREMFSAEEFAALIERYRQLYYGAYGDGNSAIVEEILADAYAGMNAFRDGVPVLRTLVQESVANRQDGVFLGGGVQNNSNAKYSIKKTRNMPYASQVEQIENKTLNGSNSMYVGVPGTQLQNAGFSDAPFAMNQGDYRKARRDEAANKSRSAHGVDKEFFEGMPQYINDAPMLIDNGVMVTIITPFGMKDTRGNDSYVIAGVWRDQEIQGEPVNQIKSAYPLDDFKRRVNEASEAGRLVVVNKNKAEEMLTTIGVQTAEVSRILNLAKDSIAPIKKNVNYSISSRETPNTHYAVGRPTEVDENGEEIHLPPGWTMEQFEEESQRAAKELAEEEVSAAPGAIAAMLYSGRPDGKRPPVTLQDAMEHLAGKDSEPDLPEGADLGRHVEKIVDEERRQQASTEPVRREDFVGSEAMNELGIRVDGSVVDYSDDRAAYLVAEDKAGKKTLREIKKAEKRLGATVKEKSLANSVVAGVLTEANLKAMNAPDVDVDKVLLLADYYASGKVVGESRLTRQKHVIRRAVDAEMHEMLDGGEIGKKVSPLLMNALSTQRLMRKVFGDKKGERVYKAVFESGMRNEAEKMRWMTKMFDGVRKFEGSDGKAEKLNRAERAAAFAVIEGRAAAEEVQKSRKRAILHAAAQKIAKGTPPADALNSAGLTADERSLAERYAAWLKTEAALETGRMEWQDGKKTKSGDIDRLRVENAADAYSKRFNQFYEAINEFLVMHGYETIGFIKGYAPHLQPEPVLEGLSSVFQKMGITEPVMELSTDIAGQTADRKPGKRFDPYFMNRTGTDAVLDIAKAYESYVGFLADIFYHADDIARVRGMERYLRETYSADNIGVMIEEAKRAQSGTVEEIAVFLRDVGELEHGSSITAQEAKNKLEAYIDGLYERVKLDDRHNTLVVWLNNYAQILAAKQSQADRGAEYSAGRRWLRLGQRILQLFARTNVGGNVSSALNQLAQLPQVVAEFGPVNASKALWDVVTGKMRKGGWVDNSDFLAGKRGVNWLTYTIGEKGLQWLFKPSELTDRLVSTVAARAAWYQAVDQGADGVEAMRIADRAASNVMGSRMKGEKPLRFHSKNLASSMINIFQTEVLNTLEHATMDIPYEVRQLLKEKGKAETAKYVTSLALQVLVYSFLLNRVSEELYGGTPAPFDFGGFVAGFLASGNEQSTNDWLLDLIDRSEKRLAEDKDFNLEAAFGDFFYNVSNDLPFVSNLAGFAGWGDKTLPMPDLWGRGKEVYESMTDEDGISWDTAESAGEFLAQFVPGGRQLQKTYEGAKVMAQGGSVKGSGDNAQLQYPVDGDVGEWIQALLFGRSALPETDQFYAEGAKGLSATHTKAYNEMVEGGTARREAYDLLREAKAKKAELEKEDMTSAARATAFARWVDEQDWSEENKAIVKDAVTFWTMSKAEPEKYETMSGAGLSPEVAHKVSETVRALKPLEGKKQVSALQKYQAIVGMGLDEEQTMAAVSVYMPEETRLKLDTVSAYGVLCADYVGYLASADADQNGSVSQEEAEAYIDSIDGLDDAGRAAIWQVANKRWKPWNNPYDTDVGEQIYEQFHDGDEDDGEDDYLADLWK